MNVEIFWDIIDILTTMLSGVLFFWFINKISRRKKSFTFAALAYVSFFCIMMVSQSLHTDPFWEYLFTLGVCDIFILMGYCISIKEMLIADLCYIVVSLISYIFIVGILVELNGYRIIEFINIRGGVNAQVILLSKLINFILLFFIVRKFYPKVISFNKKEMFLLIVQTISYIISMYVIIEITILTKRNDFYIMLVILSSIFIVCYFNFYLLICRCAKDRVIKEEYIKRQAYSEQLFQYYKLKEESKINVQKLAHDMKHHILALQDMITKTENMQAQNYLNKIEDVLRENKKYYDTGCSTIDVILSEKISQAEQYGIKVNILYEPECLKEYEPFLLCSIMGNAFDNAMRALNNIEKDEKWIDIKIRLDKEKKVLIMVNNPYYGILKKKDGKFITTKKDKKNHGLGLECIEDAVNRLKGEMSILDEDNVFSLMILI